MGRRYVLEDMIRASDFKAMYSQLSKVEQAQISELIQRLIDENPSCRLKRSSGPLYYMIHYLMSDLYVSLAIYQVRQDHHGVGLPGRSEAAHSQSLVSPYAASAFALTCSMTLRIPIHTVRSVKTSTILP